MFKGFNADYSRLDAQTANVIKQFILQSQGIVQELNDLRQIANNIKNNDDPNVIDTTRYFAIFRDEKASGTVGGTFSSGADRTRALIERYNNITGASISSNQITLPAGTYKIFGWTTGYRVNRFHNWFYNTTDSSVAINGGSGFSANGSAICDSRPLFSGVITITGSKVFELRERCETTSADTNGLGVPASFGTEVYAEIVIEKIA